MPDFDVWALVQRHFSARVDAVSNAVGAPGSLCDSARTKRDAGVSVQKLCGGQVRLKRVSGQDRRRGGAQR